MKENLLKSITQTIALLLMFVATSLPTFSQRTAIKGKITEASTGQPLPGVTVQLKGTTIASMTNNNGEFTMEVSENSSTLVISFIGYKTVEVPVSSDIQVALESDTKSLQEVVVVGYQTMRKSDITGSIASVKSSELNLSTPTVGQALVGKVSGVQISQVSGAPYNSTKIRVRGTSSINASSDPLYVIDGYPSNSDLFLNMEDIESIEVLKDAASAAIYGSRASGGVVLITTKRGREGKTSLTYDYQFGINQLARKVEVLNAEQFFDLFVDAHNKTYKDLMISQGKTWSDEYMRDDNATRTTRTNNVNASTIRIPEYMYDFATGTIKKPEYDTDWQDELYRNAANHRHNLGIVGGRNGVRYAVSGGYQDQQGIMLNTDMKKYNLRSNIDIDITKKLTIGANLAYTDTKSNEVTEGRFHQSPVLAALIYLPFLKAYNDDGTPAQYEMSSQSSDYAFQSNIENPIAYTQMVKNLRKTARATYNMYGQFKIIEPLTAKLSFGTYNYTNNWEYYRPTSITSGVNPPYSPQAITAAYAENARTNERDYLTEFTLNFNKRFGDYVVNGVLGSAAQSHQRDMISVTANGFTDDKVPYITGGGSDASNFSRGGSTGITKHAMVSGFGRVNVNYLNRYHLTASFRGDGSSLFGPKNRWAYFPSISGGWTISDETFYKNFIGQRSTLKLRASWGISGNNSIGTYNFQQVMGKTGVVIGNTVQTAMYPGAFRDDKLGWESTSQTNVGLDLGLFNGRLQAIANYYDSYTYNLLFSKSITALSGSTTMLTNLPDSKINNRGFDFQLDGIVMSSKDFEVRAGGNISFNRNKVLDLGGASTILTRGAERGYDTHITMEGHPIGMFYGYKVAGMVKTQEEADAINNSPDVHDEIPARSASQSTKIQPGDLYFVDTNQDGIVNDLDKTIIGNPHPDFIYAINLSGRYKNFDISVSGNGSQGNMVLDGQNYYNLNMEGSGNQYAIVDQRFRTPENPGNGEIYRAARGGTQSNSTRLSTFYLNDGSFFRITNITIGYSLNTSRFSKNAISKVRVYVSSDNLFTAQKYRGYNPEVDYNNGSNLTPGVDYGKYPLMRSFNAGVKVQF
ncbi:SusC/RagA family TonB-linked outer membrane protein [Leadbetterella byssophila]|uniref:SusC/RagA family TonB-linked outer membrane protein n=1 Tax=Leadbetterella byssophila TaxID=316068 RepID=UPI0039A36BD4